MNVDSKVITVALFLLVQGATAVWWGSGLSSKVEQLSSIQPGLVEETQNCAVAIHDQGQQIERIKELTAETSGLDVLAFKVDELRRTTEKEIGALIASDVAQRKTMDEIMAQHECIFTALQNAGPMQQQSIKGYGYN